MRCVTLASHIKGLPETSDFEFQQISLPELKDGQFLVKNHYVSVDPGMRSRLSALPMQKARW